VPDVLPRTLPAVAERRQRRDLVPLRQAVAVFGERPRFLEADDDVDHRVVGPVALAAGARRPCR
jgi:hypothetical protein